MWCADRRGGQRLRCGLLIRHLRLLVGHLRLLIDNARRLNRCDLRRARNLRADQASGRLRKMSRRCAHRRTLNSRIGRLLHDRLRKGLDGWLLIGHLRLADAGRCLRIARSGESRGGVRRRLRERLRARGCDLRGGNVWGGLECRLLVGHLRLRVGCLYARLRYGNGCRLCLIDTEEAKTVGVRGTGG